MSDRLIHLFVVILVSASASCSTLPECILLDQDWDHQSMCQEILNSTHTFGPLLGTEHPIDNNEVEAIPGLASTLVSPISAECIDFLLHLGCFTGIPPCSPNKGLPVLICEEHCTLYQQVKQAGLCSEVEEHFKRLQILSNSETFAGLTTAYFQLDCSVPSTYFFINVTDSEPNLCTSIFSQDAERVFKFRLCELGVGHNCSSSTRSCKNCETPQGTGSILLKAVLPVVVVVLSSAVFILVTFLVFGYRIHHKRKVQSGKTVELRKEVLKCGKRSSCSTTNKDENSLPQKNQESALGNGVSEWYRNKFSEITIPFSSLSIGEAIGQGAFGKVFEGKVSSPSNSMDGQRVALKTIKNSSDSNLESFLSEGVVMKKFCHPNVLGLVGVVLDTPDGTPHLVLPFMENGNLKTFLKSKRGQSSKANFLPDDLKISDLVKICIDISQGMKYLAGQLFVHRDLAARNCMVDTDLQVKIGDFGLSRDIYTTDYYRISDKSAKLPVKWLPPETFNDGISNEKTDIWAFGVTCWEVFSLGRTPYPAVPNSEIFAYITEGGRLEKPTLCPEEMFDVMVQCWEKGPEKRPHFVEVTQTFLEYWEDKFEYL